MHHKNRLVQAAQVWDGSYALVKLLKSPEGGRLRGARVLELGSGIGLAGLFAAAEGCHVLLTDVGPVVDLVRANIAANKRTEFASDADERDFPPSAADVSQTCQFHTSLAPIETMAGQEGCTKEGCRARMTQGEARWSDPCRSATFVDAVMVEGGLQEKLHDVWDDQGRQSSRVGDRGADDVPCDLCGAPEHVQAERANDLKASASSQEVQLRSCCCNRQGERKGIAWAEASSIGCGSAAAMELDWEEDLATQAEAGPNDPRTAQFIIASEVLWLADLVEPFVRTLAAILAMQHRPECFMTYTHRGKDGSRTFAQVTAVLDCMRANRCEVQCLEGFRTQTDDRETVEVWRIVASLDSP
jgi:hypothetical protein